MLSGCLVKQNAQGDERQEPLSYTTVALTFGKLLSHSARTHLSLRATPLVASSTYLVVILRRHQPRTHHYRHPGPSSMNFLSAPLDRPVSPISTQEVLYHSKATYKCQILIVN